MYNKSRSHKDDEPCFRCNDLHTCLRMIGSEDSYRDAHHTIRSIVVKRNLKILKMYIYVDFWYCGKNIYDVKLPKLTPNQRKNSPKQLVKFFGCRCYSDFFQV